MDPPCHPIWEFCFVSGDLIDLIGHPPNHLGNVILLTNFLRNVKPMDFALLFINFNKVGYIIIRLHTNVFPSK